jgi:hypothetical protein
MKKAEQLGIVGILLSMSVGFWGKDMADYVETKLVLPAANSFVKANSKEYPALAHLAVTNKDWTNIYSWSELAGLPVTNSPGNPRGLLTWMGANRRIIDFARTNTLSRTDERAKAELEFYQAAERSLWERLVSWLGVLFAGCVFMVDVACIYWWYFRYIYKIQTMPTLRSMFYDIAVCASFNLAAARWTNSLVFLMASGAGSSLLIARFIDLYRSPEASFSDRTIIKRAGWQIGVLVVSLTLVYLLLRPNVDQTWQTLLYAALVAGLSGIGIILTVLSRERIRLSIEQQAVPEKRFTPMELLWPESLKEAPEAREQIRDNSRKGILAFRGLFTGGSRRYTRMVSRVHAEGDLFIQSYILAVPSWHEPSETTQWGRRDRPLLRGAKLEEDEVERKAWMVAASHWLDDLVDGREELGIHARTRHHSDWIYSHDEEKASRAFDLIYRKIVKQHTDLEFYTRLVREIRNQTTVPMNCAFLFSGLNRVGLGSLLFSPKIDPTHRREMLNAHNLAFVRQVTESEPPVDTGVDGRKWLEDVKTFLNRLERGPDEMGDLLLGLTTKTVAEISMASEGPNVYFPLAALYSLLYAPLLYFHDIDPEIESQEMGVLEAFDVNVEALCGWMNKVRSLIERVPDERKESRLLQAEMAYNCFRDFVPKFIRDEFKEAYVTRQERLEPIESP